MTDTAESVRKFIRDQADYDVYDPIVAEDMLGRYATLLERVERALTTTVDEDGFVDCFFSLKDAGKCVALLQVEKEK